MQKWSIKTKLIALCSGLTGLILIVGAIGMVEGRVLTDLLDDVNRNQLPAVRDMGRADMMHDALRAVVLHSLISASQNDEASKKEIAEELKENSESFVTYIENIDKLDIEPETKKAIDEVEPEIAAYVKSGEEIVVLALAGHRDLAMEKLPAFLKIFKSLEKRLAILEEAVEKDADQTRKGGEKTAERFKVANIFIIIFGLLTGAGMSFWIIRNLMQNLSKTISQLTESSEHVSEASSASALSASQLSEAVTEQAASLQETMASIEEISAMINQNDESAAKMKSAVDMNQKVSEEGMRSVSSMVAAIDEIKATNDQILAQMETSNKEFAEIVRIITEIGDKTKVINDIVFQTKLLSFNASVEAARAGEHGKGFAVVAEEVGSLAQMSGNAAKEISDMLADSIKKVNEIVDATTKRVDHLVEVGKDKIVMGQSTAQKCREALNKIADNAKSVVSMVSEITHASKEQAQGISEINKAVSQLDQVTQQNSSVAQKSSSQAESLRAESQALTDSVDLLVRFATGQKAQLNAGFVNATKADAPKRTVASVIEMKQKRPKANAANKSENSAKVIESRAAISDIVPSSDDPNFEEF